MVPLKHLINFSVCVLILLDLLECVHLSSDENCKQDSLCSCKTDDYELNISGLTQNYIQTNGETNEDIYYYSGCKNKNFSEIIKVNSSNCTDTALCLRQSKGNTSILIDLGKAKDGKFQPSSMIPSAYQIAYQKENIMARVLFVCDPELPTSSLFLQHYNRNDGVHNLLAVSPHTCKYKIDHKEHRGLSTGSTLTIIFFTFFGTYFVTGACVLYFIRGGRGLEIIPNLSFWRELPSLVRDGTLFLINGCNPVIISTAETYDRI